MKTKTSWALTFIVVFFAMSVLVGCSEKSEIVTVPLELPTVVVIESETGCLNLNKEAVPCEEIEPIHVPNPMIIPEPYKGWGWTVQEHDALVLCEGLGGKMGSSKNCRMQDAD